MSFFRKDPPADAPPPPAYAPPAGGGPALTRIAKGSTVCGALAGPVELLIEGEVEGEIRTEAKVVVAAGGQVRGPITASVVLIAGQVAGDVRGSDRVEVSPSGNLEGDIYAPRIVVSEGAFFKGKVEMQGNQAGTARSPRAGAETKAAAETRKS